MTTFQFTFVTILLTIIAANQIAAEIRDRPQSSSTKYLAVAFYAIFILLITGVIASIVARASA